MIEVARAAHQAGLCVVPPREDGTKAPEGSWKRYIEHRPDEDQIERWYSNGRQGIGLVCGKVSGGLECFEFEATAIAENLHREYRRLCEAAGYGDVLSRVLNGYTEETPSGGMHVLWRCEEIGGNQKLARRPSTPEERATDPNPIRVLIETRGEGGYAVVAPSNGSVHPSGKPWKLLRGSFSEIATITPQERSELLRLARTLDRMVTPPARVPEEDAGDRPGDAFNADPRSQERIAMLLWEHGWKEIYKKDDAVYLRRPGKERGVSATLGYVAPGVFYCFSTSTVFESEKGYSPFQVYAFLEHKGDFSGAARGLRGEGYGKPSRRSTGEAESEKATSDSQIDRLTALSSPWRVICDTTANVFAIHRDGPPIALPLNDLAGLRGRMVLNYWGKYGRPPNPANVIAVLNGLEARARTQPTTLVPLRTGRQGDHAVIDLGTADGRAVVIKPGGWNLETSPVAFRRTDQTHPLPPPEINGTLDGLSDLLALSGEEWAKVLTWMLCAFMSEAVHPVLIFRGPQGSGKTARARMISRLIDPTDPPTRSAPKDSEEWSITANASWVIALDNLSRIQDWLSDALCRAATGEGLLRRRLYTDSGVSALSYRRCVMVTTIDPGRIRGDLADRMIVVDCPEPSSRMADWEIDRAVKENHARWLGGLCDLAAQVWAVLPTIARGSGRLVDYDRILVAVDQLLDLGVCAGVEQGRHDLALDVLESDSFLSALVEWIEKTRWWKGTATELEIILRHGLDGRTPKDWPSSPRGVSAVLTRGGPTLEKMGIEITRVRESGGKSGGKRTRLIEISVVGGTAKEEKEGERGYANGHNSEFLRPPESAHLPGQMQKGSQNTSLSSLFKIEPEKVDKREEGGNILSREGPQISDPSAPLSSRDWTFLDESRPCEVCREPCIAVAPDGHTRHPTCPLPEAAS